mmetsp:Transcript_108904/g.303646  ORF Transcript_108904/g.303646 Transcript_108904/m.303646 type:complete len:463 (-) Transcript_108904:3-1391(-)
MGGSGPNCTPAWPNHADLWPWSQNAQGWRPAGQELYNTRAPARTNGNPKPPKPRMLATKTATGGEEWADRQPTGRSGDGLWRPPGHQSFGGRTCAAGPGLSELVVRLRWEGASAALHDHGRSIRTGLAACLHVQALGQSRQEATHVGVTGAVGVHKLLLWEHDHGVLLDHAVDGDDRWLTTLGDDRSPLPALRTGDQRQPRGDELHVLGVPAFALRPSGCLCLVPEEEVHERHGVGEDLFERGDLHEEGRRQVHAINFAVLQLLFRGQFDGLGRHRDEEARAVHNVRRLHQLPVVGLLAMVRLVVVRRVEVRAQGALDAGDQGGAHARRRGLVHHVGGLHAVGLAGLLELVAVRVLADAAHVGGAAGRLQHPLGYADAVLGSATGNVLHIRLLHHLAEEGLVLLLGEDGVARQQLVFVQQGFVHLGRDVQERVAHAEDRHLGGSCARGWEPKPCKRQAGQNC